MFLGMQDFDFAQIKSLLSKKNLLEDAAASPASPASYAVAANHGYRKSETEFKPVNSITGNKIA